jgi:hypothetical protein
MKKLLILAFLGFCLPVSAQTIVGDQSRCQLLPSEADQPVSETSISLRIVNPNGPEINVRAIFHIPPEITPVNLSVYKTWDEASRSFTVNLGDFAASEEKQLLLDFEGRPVACIVIGVLEG